MAMKFGKTPLLIAGGAAVGVIAIGGAGLAFAGDGPEQRDGDAADAANVSQAGGSAGSGVKVDLLKAAETAAGEVPGGVVHDIELDDGQWEVDLVVADGKREHDLRVDADSGKVTDKHDGRAEAEDLQVADAKVTLAEAVAAAEKKLGDGKVTEAQFEGIDRDDDGRGDDDGDDREDTVAHWSLEANGADDGSGDDGDDDGDDASEEVTIDAESGKTVKFEDD